MAGDENQNSVQDHVGPSILLNGGGHSYKVRKRNIATLKMLMEEARTCMPESVAQEIDELLSRSFETNIPVPYILHKFMEARLIDYRINAMYIPLHKIEYAMVVKCVGDSLTINKAYRTPRLKQYRIGADNNLLQTWLPVYVDQDYDGAVREMWCIPLAMRRRGRKLYFPVKWKHVFDKDESFILYFLG